MSRHRKNKHGTWTTPIPEPQFGDYARNPELDPNYRYLEEEDYIPTEEDPDMDIILDKKKK